MTSELQTCLEALPAACREMRAGRLTGSGADAESLAKALIDPRNVREGWKRIGDSARRLLLELVWFTPGWIRDREMAGLLRCLPTFGEIRRALETLHGEGWLYAARGQGNERVRLVPAEVRAAFMELWLRDVPVTRRDEPRFCPAGSGNAGLGQAFFHFLASCDLQPIPVTASGRLSLRDAQKLDVELDLDSGVFAGTRWESAGGLPPWIAFLAEIAEAMGLAGMEDGRFAVRKDRFASWLAQPYPVMVCRLYRTVRDLFAREVPESGGFWLMLESMKPGRWVGLKELSGLIAALQGGKKPLSNQRTASWEKAADFLEAAGWLWTGVAEEDRMVQVTGEPPWTDDWPEDSSLFLEPGMELLIPFNFPLRCRYELAKMADYMGGERMLAYVLTESSLRRARRHGLGAEEIASRLSAWTGGPLPGWAAGRISEWIRNDRAVWLEEAVLIRADGTGEPDRVMQALLESGWRVKALENGSWAVSGSGAEAVRRLLEKEGWQVETVSASLPPADPDAMEEAPVRGFRVEEAEAGRPDPEKMNIPKIWTSGLRTYPPAMIREILQKSLDGCCDVLAEVRGAKRLLSPERCTRRRGEWVLEAREGGKKTEVRLGEIGRIQLVLEQKTEDLAGDFL